jgi:hypothetical protein
VSGGVKVRMLFASLIVLIAFGVTFVLTRDGEHEGGKGGAPTTVVRRDGAAVTEDDNGREVTVPPNEPFVVDLQGSPDAPWGLPVSQAVGTLALVGSSQELDGSVRATFVPLDVTPGVVVSAQRTGKSSERFEVTIRVVG